MATKKPQAPKADATKKPSPPPAPKPEKKQPTGVAAAIALHMDGALRRFQPGDKLTKEELAAAKAAGAELI